MRDSERPPLSEAHAGGERQCATLAASIIAHSDDAIIAKTLDGTVLSWNAAAERIFGYTADDMIGQCITRLFPQDRLHEEAKLMAQVQGGGEITHFETLRVRKDGSLIDVSVTLSAIRDDDGRIVAASKIARDITNRNLLQAQARLAVELQHGLDQSSLRVGLWGSNERNLYSNVPYAAGFGLTPEALIGRHFSDVLDPVVYAMAKPLADAARAGQAQLLERPIMSSDGRLRHELLNLIPGPRAPAPAGEPSGLFIVITDITRQVHAEQTAAAAAERFQRLYEDTPAMAHASAPDGRLLAVSNTWLKNLGYTRDEVLGTDVDDYLTPQSRIVRQAARQQMAETDHCEHVALEVVCKSGQVMDVLMSAAFERDAEGRVLRSLTVLQDVTGRLRAERALAKSEALLNRTGALAGVGGWELNLKSGELTWSDQTRRMHGVDASFQPRLESAIDFYAPEDRPAIRAAVTAAVAGGPGWDLQLALFPATGLRIWVRATGHAEFEGGQPVRLVGAFQDITVLHVLGAQLAQQLELMRVTLKSIGDAVVTTDARGHITWLNPMAERMTGWLSREAEGRPSQQVLNLVHENTRAPVESPIDACLRDQDTAGLAHHTVLISRNGTEYGIEDSAAPIRNAEGAILGCVLVFHDVTEQRRISSEMTHRATHDALTGLVNRAEFETRLKRVLELAQRRHSKHALLYIDLDQFKLVNDACGHSVGDQLLKQISALLGEVVRSRDTLARLGGDEFAVILEHCGADQAKRVAQTICDRMDDFRFIHDDRRFRVGASIGLVPLDERWATASAVMLAADASCYAAKEAGRNRVHFWFDTDTAMHTRHGQTQWAARLEQALDEGAFALHLQRIVPLKTASRGLHGEVLLRLRDADGSLISPGVFLPAAERFHLAARVDRWVIHQVVRQLKALPSLKVIDLIAINVSGQSVGDRSFHRSAVEELRAAGPAVCQRLCIEVTETAAITNLAEAALFIEQLRDLGVRTALDDFGAGASSFGYLKRLKVNVLKIDGQFVRDILDDPLDDAAVRCFVDVARVLGVECVAEFVDRPAVLAKVQELGVDYAQGFLLHQPEDMAKVLAACTA